MTTLHMETELTRDLANRLNRTALNMDAKESTVRSARNRLSSAWQGGGAEDFRSDLDNWIRSFELQVSELQRLSLRVAREVDEWEHADNNHSFGDSSHLGQIFVDGGGLGPGFTGNDGDDTPFDWWGSIGGAWGGADDYFDFFETFKDHMIYEDYKDIGRWINDKIGEPHGGWVGRWDRIGHFVEGPGFDIGVGIGSETISGLFEGEDVATAIASGGIEFGIKKGLKYLIPGVGAALVISGGVQLVGNLAAMGLEATGNHESAVLLQNGLEAVNLGGYVGDFSDGVADMVLPPWNEPPDFSDLGDRFGKLVDLGESFFR